MPRKTVRNAWESLKKKFIRQVKRRGSPTLKSLFAADDDVRNKFRSALAIPGLHVEDERNVDEEDTNLSEALQIHVFDMNVSTLRKIVDTAVTPKNALSCKDKRKNLYIPENAPNWWIDTGLPFKSINHKTGTDGHFRQLELWRLVESLQHHCGITPNPPSKVPKIDTFVSRFYQDRISDQPSTVQQPSGSVDMPECSSLNTSSVDPAEMMASSFFSCEEVQLSESVDGRRTLIQSITEEKLRNDPKDIASILLKAECWEELTVLCARLSSLVQLPPEIPATQWDMEEYNAELYSQFEGAEYYKGVQTTANGNCLFNAVSLIFHGKEDLSNFYRLMTIIDAVDRLLELSKYILKEYKADWSIFASMICDLPPDSFGSELSPLEVLENIFRHEIKETLRSFYRDCCNNS